jgi:serine/threonine-protein kinase
MEACAKPGEIIDRRYQIVRLIDRGSMADVFEAHDSKMDRGVALKILRGKVSKDPEAIERLKREAHVQSMISHRNVAAVYGGGATRRNEPYLVVELLQGQSLRRVVRAKGPVPADRAASYIWQALQGLGAAHSMGVFHRDLKPANLMLEPSEGPVERVVVIDFGFAALEGGTRLTKAGHVVGSLAYLAPERLQGDPGSAGADLYALGVILYELLTGTRPFLADDDYQLIEMQLDATPKAPSVVAPDVRIPPALEAVVMRALAKSPVQRAEHAVDMARDIEEAMASF